MSNILKRIVEEKPLIHHITNNVTVNDCANITLLWGGLPVMAHNPLEVEQMVERAQALVLNLGAIDFEPVTTLIKAGQKANQLGIPVIFDPVGAGATKFRTDQALKLIEKVEPAIIKGNAGEITIISGKQAEVRGVEATGEYEGLINNTVLLAQKLGTVVMVSGSQDLVTDGSRLYRIENGHPLLGKVVGTGCMLGSTLGIFAGVEGDYLRAALEAGTAYSIAGELAGSRCQYPASFKIEFMDQVSQLDDQALNKKQVYEQVELTAYSGEGKL